jgi:hypothetical protein
MAERRDDWGNERKPVFALIRDQHAQMFGLAVAHDHSDVPPSLVASSRLLRRRQ